jgi:hypothetical protein
MAGTGCQFLMRRDYAYQNFPRVLPESPTLDQVVAAVNQNSQQIYSFSTNKAELSVSGTPTLNANIAMTRPHNFRLQAGLPVMGPELDLGSNDQYFWFWVKRDKNKAVYYCEHDQFESSPLRQQMPISPKELIEAFGLVEFDPALPHHLSTNRADGHVEVRTVYQTTNGPMTRVVVVHGAYGWVLQEALYNSQEQLIMYAQAKKHRRDPLSGLVMPEVVVVNLPQNQMTMRVDLGDVMINTLDNPNPELWTIPEIQGTKMVNIGGPPVEPPSTQAYTPTVPAYTDPYGTNPNVPILNETGSF